MERLEHVIGDYLDGAPESRCFWWDGKWYDRAFLKKLSDETTGRLRASGFSEGQRLAALMPNTPMLLALSLAAWRLGGAFCPLNHKSGVQSLTATLELLEPCAVILSDETREGLEDVLKERGWPSAVCPPMGPLPELRCRTSGPESGDIAVIFSTSGTTGMPKAVPITHANLLDNCRQAWDILDDLKKGDVLLNALPNFHALGYMSGTVLPFVIDGSQALVPTFLPPSRTLSSIIDASVNVVILVPMMLNFLVGLIEKGARKPEGIKILVTGGDRYNSLMDKRVEKAMGLGVTEGYGLTECSPVVALNRGTGRRRLGTVGEFLGGYEWKLRDESGKDLPAAVNEGVLWVRGPSVTSGYFRTKEKDGSRFGDGWFNTEDYVLIEGEYVKILDRVTDIIIVNGFNVYPQEVEAIMHQHPAVQSAVVIGLPNPQSGEIPKAFVQKRHGAEVTELELLRFCKERLAHYKVPRKVEFVESLPLSGIGKVLRRVLREREREK